MDLQGIFFLILGLNLVNFHAYNLPMVSTARIHGEYNLQGSAGIAVQLTLVTYIDDRHKIPFRVIGAGIIYIKVANGSGMLGSRSKRRLKMFSEFALTVSSERLFQKGKALVVKNRLRTPQ